MHNGVQAELRKQPRSPLNSGNEGQIPINSEAQFVVASLKAKHGIKWSVCRRYVAKSAIFESKRPVAPSLPAQTAMYFIATQATTRTPVSR